MNTTIENISLRNMVLHNPDISLEDVRAKFKELRYTAKPADIGQRLSSARFNTKQKYGLTSLKQIPFVDGKPDVGGLVRLLRKKSPSISVLQIKTCLASDGFNVNDQFINDSLMGRPTNTNGKPHSPTTQQEETKVPVPDTATVPVPAVPASEAAAATAPPPPKPPKPDLTGHPSKPAPKKQQAPKKGKSIMEELDNEVANTYLSMEDEIDDLINKARKVSDTSLVESLKAARRHMIVRSHKLIAK